MIFNDLSSSIVPFQDSSYDTFYYNVSTQTNFKASFLASGGNITGNTNALSASGDCRFIVFGTAASGIVSGINYSKTQIYIRDTLLSVNILVSQNDSGSFGNQNSAYYASISYDGSLVAFESEATNLSPLASSGLVNNIFLRNLTDNTTTLISVNSSSAILNSASATPNLSGNGRFVIFISSATNVDPLANGTPQLFLRDLQSQTTVLLSQTGGASFTGSASISTQAISYDGSLVVFYGTGNNFIYPDNNPGNSQCFLVNTTSGNVTRIANLPNGAQSDGVCTNPVISSDGRFIGFISTSTLIYPLIPNTLATQVAYIYDLVEGTTTPILNYTGQIPSGNINNVYISSQASTIAFSTASTDMVSFPTSPGVAQIFMAVPLCSLNNAGGCANGGSCALNGSWTCSCPSGWTDFACDQCKSRLRQRERELWRKRRILTRNLGMGG